MILNLILTATALYLLYTVLRGAPFLPSNSAAVESMIGLADIKPGQYAADLGSGDGRIVIAMAQAGAIAHGFETNPVLVWVAKRRIKKLNLQDGAVIHWKSFWGVDLSQFQIITVFGISHIMGRLGKKLRAELISGSRILSNIFTFPDWQVVEKRGTVYLYRITDTPDQPFAPGS